MNKLIIEHTSSSPKVYFDPDNGTFEISGESRPENATELYMPILKWFDVLNGELAKGKYSRKSSNFLFNFNFEYFNSLSAKYILDIFRKIGKLRTSKDDIVVKWHFEQDDEDMLEVGKDMSRLVKFPFENVQL